jgi:hypothetical protein
VAVDGTANRSMRQTQGQVTHGGAAVGAGAACQHSHGRLVHSNGDFPDSRQPAAHRKPGERAAAGLASGLWHLRSTAGAGRAQDSQALTSRPCGLFRQRQLSPLAEVNQWHDRRGNFRSVRATNKASAQRRPSCQRSSIPQPRVGMARFHARRASIRMLAAILLALAVPVAMAQPAGGGPEWTVRSTSEAESSWWMPASRNSPVRGGSLLTFAGTSFDLSAKYVARFAGIDHEAERDPSVVVESDATLPVSTTKLVVVVPAWTAHEVDVTVSLSKAGDLLPVAPGNTTNFEYLAGWSSMIGSTAPLWDPPSDYAFSSFRPSSEGICSPIGSVLCSVPVTGGALFTISGVGFQQRYCPEDDGVRDFCVDVLYSVRFTSTEDDEPPRIGTPVSSKFFPSECFVSTDGSNGAQLCHRQRRLLVELQSFSQSRHGNTRHRKPRLSCFAMV